MHRREDSPIPGFPDSPIPRFPDSPIPRFPDSPFPVLKIATFVGQSKSLREVFFDTSVRLYVISTGVMLPNNRIKITLYIVRRWLKGKHIRREPHTVDTLLGLLRNNALL